MTYISLSAGLIDLTHGPGSVHTLESRPAIEIGATGLVALGPVELIHNGYSGSISVPCSSGGLRYTVSLNDLSGNIGQGVTIVGATFHSNGALYWVEAGSYYLNGTATLVWLTFSSLGCTAVNNPAGSITLALSSGDTYELTILAQT